MALILKINGTDRSASIDWTSLAWTSVLSKEVDRLEFNIKKITGKTVPAVGDSIELLEGASKLFGGIVVERNEKIIGGLLIGYEIRCKDWSATMDSKLVVKSYSNRTADDIIKNATDGLITYMPAGFTTTNVQTPPFSTKSIKFNYEQVSRCLTQLADQIGWDWYVDPDKDIHFFAEETAAAPFNLDDTTGNFEWATFEVNQNIVNLKNYIFVRGAEYKKAIAEGSAVDSYLGDGTKKTFQLAYRYDTITVKKGGVVQTIGTDQQTDPATVDLLYNFNEKFIKFTTAPTNGATVVIYGDALIPIIAAVRDQISIATYGERQHAVIDKAITSVEEAQSRAKTELKKYSATVFEGRFKTTKTGLRVGQSITVQSTYRNFTSKTFKINRVIGKARGNDHMEYEVFLLASGEITFTDIMVGLLSKDYKNITIATNEVLQRLDQFAEAFNITDVLSSFKKSRPYTWGNGGANDALSPRGWDFATWA